MPGEISDADWFLDATALLVAVDHDARTRLYRYDLAGGSPATPIGPAEAACAPPPPARTATCG